jgi:hypothetical protein
MYRIRQFFKRIYNLYRWLPIIWKDQDWDDYFIFEILKFKLKNQAEYIGKKDRHVSAKRDAEIMMLCVRLIEKVQKEYYEGEYFDYHKSDLKFIPSKKYPDHYEMDVKLVSENFSSYFKKYPRIFKEVIESEKYKLPLTKKVKEKVAFKVARINGDRAHKLLFKILEENIKRWWD